MTILTIPAAAAKELDNAMAILDGWRVKEIIEPTVLRDWTAEDAKKHIGCMWMSPITGMIGFVGAHDDLRPWKDSQYGIGWSDRKYARPIPGTDPAKWDWKPCKVEVPVEKANAEPNVGMAITRLADLRASISRDCTLPAIAQNYYADCILRICALLEQP